jgi:Ala-tRNA(Pro) deacylase
MRYSKDDVLARLTQLGLAFQLYEHPAVFTVEESQQHCAHIPGVHCKNLFLKDKKDKLWVVTAPDERKIDLKVLPDKIGKTNVSCARLSFGNPDLLLEVLGVLPGSVTPLAVINDTAKRVTPVLDAWMMQQESLNFHPLINTATIAMRPKDLLAFMQRAGYAPLQVEL